MEDQAWISAVSKLTSVFQTGNKRIRYISALWIIALIAYSLVTNYIIAPFLLIITSTIISSWISAYFVHIHTLWYKLHILSERFDKTNKGIVFPEHLGKTILGIFIYIAAIWAATLLAWLPKPYHPPI